jgi:hypothetical protein
LPNEPPAEIKALIDAHINGFNTHDDDLFLGVFGDTAIIIDGIAPYRWLNPNAPANWLADVEKWRKNLGVTKEHLSCEMGFSNVAGLSAYAVISGTLTVTIKGSPSFRPVPLRTRSRTAMASGRSRRRLGAARRSLLCSGFRTEFDIAGTKSECRAYPGGVTDCDGWKGNHRRTNTVSSLTLFGIAALILALAVAFYFERQAPGKILQSNSSGSDK